jgi:hypothetical protein
MYVPNISSVFFRCMLQVNYLDVAYIHTYVASVLSGCCMCLQLFFKCFKVFLHVFQAHFSNVSAVSYICCNCFIWMFQSRSRCCVCCNMSHLPQLPTAATGAPCMEGSGAADMEGHRKQESVGEWRERPHLCVQQALARASGRGGSTRTSGLQCYGKPIDVMEAPR